LVLILRWVRSHFGHGLLVLVVKFFSATVYTRSPVASASARLGLKGGGTTFRNGTGERDETGRIRTEWGYRALLIVDTFGA